MPETLALAARIASKPLPSLMATKRLLLDAEREGIARARELENRAFAELLALPERAATACSGSSTENKGWPGAVPGTTGRWRTSRTVWTAASGSSSPPPRAWPRRPWCVVPAVTTWRTTRHEDPPENPAAHDVGWRDALAWTVAIGVGASVARVVAQRGAAKAWEKATGDPPPIVT